MTTLSTCLKSVALAATAAFAFGAAATPVVGIVNLTVGQVAISAGSIDWNNAPLNINPPPNGANVTIGNFGTIPLQTGSFAAFPILSAGTIRDMADPVLIPSDTGNAFPLATPTTITNFLTFSAQPQWAFEANFLVAGGLPGTPFSLAQLGNNVSVTMSINGKVCDMGGDSVCNAGDDITRWTGIFSSQYTNTTVAALVAAILGGGTLNNNGWSATIEASRIVSEPTSLALVGLSLLGLGAVARRRSNKSA
jgi:hypothetical protein